MILVVFSQGLFGCLKSAGKTSVVSKMKRYQHVILKPVRLKNLALDFVFGFCLAPPSEPVLSLPKGRGPGGLLPGCKIRKTVKNLIGLPIGGDMIDPMATTTFEKFLPTMQENSKTVRNTYISFLTLTTFIWISIESVTHRMLLIPDENLTLPLIQVKIPIVGFFWAAPFLLVLFQLYFQVHVFRFARDLAKVRDDAKKQMESAGNDDGDGAKAKKKAAVIDSITDIPSDWKSQLQGNLFTWNFIDQKSRYEFHVVLSSFIVALSFYWYGVLVLLRVQWVFLPHHHSALTTTHFSIVLFSLAISFYFRRKVERLKENSGNKVWKKKFWWLYYFPGYFLAVLGFYFTLVMSWSVLEIPFTEKENERRFGMFTWPAETWLVCFSEGVDETDKKLESNNNANNREGNPQDGQADQETSKKIRKDDPCWYSWRLPLHIFDSVDENEKEENQWLHFKISEVVVRNLNLEEAKLAIGPSEAVKAALIVKEDEALSEEEREQKLLAKYDSLNLKGRHLEFAKFRSADLRKVDLRKANLQGADFYTAKLQDADFREANMEGANLALTKLEGANLMKANLSSANMSASILKGANLRSLQATGLKMAGAHLHGANLQGANLMGGEFNSAQFQGAILSSTKLQGANLQWSNLQGTNLSFVNLQGADLTKANLEAANLEGASIQGAILGETKIYGAIFLLSSAKNYWKFDEKDIEKWALGMGPRVKLKFKETMLKRKGIKTVLPELDGVNGEPIIAHEVEEWKNEGVKTLLEINKALFFNMRQLSKNKRGVMEELMQLIKPNNEKKRQFQPIFQNLYFEQQKTWNKLLCDYPFLRKQKLEGTNMPTLGFISIFPHAPYFSKEEVQAAIKKCEKAKP
ncbi:MAG: pentapeptide repeat-containing protein [Candidatus Nitronauta litoralis]|uniref:Pentapeptide repeat-containing protein n=1 Tax=Candidatus Nitronauta litoralis TaxID=2705533 RepID=A0A7T0BUM5_9BACT|nr:MAG: pentapeptide repeat-containing protein [Candidatus Nitronauta litoralis]